MNVEASADRQRRSAKVRFRQPRTTGTYTAGTVLAIALFVSIVGSAITYFEVRAAIIHHNAVDQARTGLSTLFQLQLDEEMGLRGFLASGQKLYLTPYTTAQPKFEVGWLLLQDASSRAGLERGDTLLSDLRRSHDRWTTDVAQPLIARPTASYSLLRLQLGKALVDRMREDYAQLDGLYETDAQAASERMQALLLRAAVSTAALILVFGFAAIIADLYRSRTQAALERERVVADTLQRAFLSGWDVVPYLHVGTAYRSSTREAAIGGDLFDIHRIDDHRSVILVADVSGKGLEAAVETAQVKYSIRTLVEDYDDPAVMLSKFNRAFFHSLRDLTSFVSVFVGILDARDRTLRYASAGHAPAFVRRTEDVEQIPVTGPLVGLSEDAAYECITVALRSGDTIVLATDGITEARDSAGVLADDEGVMRWIRDGEREPDRLAEELIRRVERFTGGRINDDLALLILQFRPESANESAIGRAAAAEVAQTAPDSAAGSR